MKVLRACDQLMLHGYVEDVELNEDGDAVVFLRTYSKQTQYKLVVTEQDLKKIISTFEQKGETT
jgi:hypothetical protein